MLVLLFHQLGQHRGCVQQWPGAHMPLYPVGHCGLSPIWGGHVHLLWHSCYWWSSFQEGWLGMHCGALAGWPEHLNREIQLMLFKYREECKEWCSPGLLHLVVSRRFWRAPVVTQSSLCSFVCVYKLFSYLLVIISPNIDVHLVCSWEGTNSASSYATILILPVRWSFFFLKLIGKCSWHLQENGFANLPCLRVT